MKLINEEKKIYFVKLEMFYLNTIKQLFLLVEQLDQLEVCLPYSTAVATKIRTHLSVVIGVISFKLEIMQFWHIKTLGY